MNGLITLQINITGNLERDQQLLLFGIGGLIALIMLAMIIILIVVIVRKVKRNKLATIEANLQASTAPPQPKVGIEKVSLTNEKSFQPVEKKDVVPIAEEKRPEQTPTAVEPVIEKPIVETKIEAVVEKLIVEAPIAEKQESSTNKKESDNQSPADKIDEIRRRIEEIRNQKNTDPVPVLPKVVAKAREKEPIVEIKESFDPIFDEHEKNAPDDIDETIVVEDSESVAIPISIETEDLTEPEPAIKEPEINAESNAREEISENVHDEPKIEISHLPNGKFLPMKKLTFAEWVELFK